MSDVDSFEDIGTMLDHNNSIGVDLSDLTGTVHHWRKRTLNSISEHWNLVTDLTIAGRFASVLGKNIVIDSSLLALMESFHVGKHWNKQKHASGKDNKFWRHAKQQIDCQVEART